MKKPVRIRRNKKHGLGGGGAGANSMMGASSFSNQIFSTEIKTAPVIAPIKEVEKEAEDA